MEDEIFSEVNDDNFLTALSKNVFSTIEQDNEEDHYSRSTVDLVGLQVWRGAFFLSDYIIENYKEFLGKTVLELASGTGIPSIVSSQYASRVISTDVNRGRILETLQSNFVENESLLKAESTKVKELDFFTTDIKENDIDVILVADVVYDANITRAFFCTLEKLLKANPFATILISIEVRNRTNNDSILVAPNYQIFEALLQNLKSKFSKHNLQLVKKDFGQYFSCYDRVTELVLWKLYPITF